MVLPEVRRYGLAPSIGPTFICFYLSTEAESNLRNVYLNKNTKMNNAQRVNNYVNMPLLRTSKCYVELYSAAVGKITILVLAIKFLFTFLLAKSTFC
jgi:hypothetical protein